MISVLRLTGRAAFALFCIMTIIVLMSVTWGLGARRATRRIMQAAFRISAPVLGIRIRVTGTLSTARPLIVVSNHFSYLDLFVLGSVVPAAFTPKSEIRSWPLLGFMSKVSGCLFIDRRAIRTIANKRLLEKALAAGDIISLFPEGTTNDGTALLPFRSSYFGLARETGTPVQPVSIVYTRLNDEPLSPERYGEVGWFGDALFFPHLMRFLRQKNLDAALLLHPPLDATHYASRKELAHHCKTVIEGGVAQMIKP